MIGLAVDAVRALAALATDALVLAWLVRPVRRDPRADGWAW